MSRKRSVEWNCMDNQYKIAANKKTKSNLLFDDQRSVIDHIFLRIGSTSGLELWKSRNQKDFRFVLYKV